MFRSALTLALVGLLAACATTTSLPPPPAHQAADGSRVGIIVTGLDQTAIHQHVGTTVLNNFSAQKTLPWHLGEHVKASLSAALSKRGLEPVQLELSELRNVTPESLVVRSTSQTWEVPSASSDVVRDLQDKHRIASLVVVTGKPTVANLECRVGCVERVLPKTGLFSRSVFNFDDYFVVAGYETLVLLFKPVANLSPYDPIRSVTRNQSKQLDGDEEPNDPRSISDREFTAISKAIDEYTQNVAAAVAESIKTGPKLPK